MQRHSNRLIDSTSKSSAEGDNFEPENEGVAEEENDDLQLSKKPRKRRKAADSKLPQAKKVRGKRGILKQLIEMPLDLLFEIFGRLEPLDLLHLTRTTKDLRALLMNRSSTSIWKQSRSNIPGMPDCPSDLSEAQYAHFMFGKSCHFCHRNLSNLRIVCSARLRTCTKCLEEKFTEKYFDWLHRRDFPMQLAEFVPAIFISKRSGPSTRQREMAYDAVDDRWAEEYKRAQDKDKWLKEKIEERKVIARHASACELWFEQMEDIREREKASILAGRKAIVVERLKKLGWEDELSRMSEEDDKPQDDPIVLKACQKDITEQTLSNLEEFLNEFMETQRGVRLVQERESLLEQRLPILRKVLQRYVTTLPPNALHPSVGELFRDSNILDIINNTPQTVDFTEANFDPIVPMLPDITIRWQKEMEEKLVDIIWQAEPAYASNRETSVNLATTSFDCKHCSACYMRFPNVLMHLCATRAYYFFAEVGSDLAHLKDILLETYWNAAKSINFTVKNAELIAEVVALCGFDPKTTTAAEMDAANPIIECVTCNDVHEGRLTMTWSSVPAHWSKKHRSIGDMKLHLLSGREADIARAGISELVERRRAGKHYMDLVCVHCKQTGNTPELRKHVHTDHGKQNPTEEDIIPLLRAGRIPCFYPLWPPRDEFEDEPSAATAVTN
ncbi:hypothetical protein GALMADRAFT_242213 [Galerina marginata CBS 339.88]|uniref:F-box domain-containing protein n=1 Tax=Galerina marginata (strain CBS 339.88) TaxID=685588 RepID=A0A067TCF4_GALM3|nr:hypothetical protein GALMADRAFT_242213 [Galerina marginata CBS 339.88]